MKISDAIAKLTELKEKHGDLPIWLNGEFGYSEMEIDNIKYEKEYIYLDGKSLNPNCILFDYY
jgi:hypothetical protein